MTGRPTKLTAELTDRICQSLRAGVPDRYAAEGNGVHRSTLYQWLALGREALGCDWEGCDNLHHGPDGHLSYADFADAVMVAEADAVRLAVGYITKAMPTDPLNARWWLERSHGNVFKPRSEIDVKPEVPQPVPFTIEVVAVDRPPMEFKPTKPSSGNSKPPKPKK